MRPVPGADIEYARATLIGLQEEIAKARSILVIGAGPVGIEVAGVCLCHPLKLIPRKLGRGTQNQLSQSSTIFLES
jgi:NADH dehydrogenase FAD-containing subunit